MIKDKYDMKHKSFQHDCPHCKFVGGLLLQEERYDMYVCYRQRYHPRGEVIDTIVIRSGEGPDEYKSYDLDYFIYGGVSGRFELQREGLALLNKTIFDKEYEDDEDAENQDYF